LRPQVRDAYHGENDDGLVGGEKPGWIYPRRQCGDEVGARQQDRDQADRSIGSQVKYRILTLPSASSPATSGK
jgi:hypothetical protein